MTFLDIFNIQKTIDDWVQNFLQSIVRGISNFTFEILGTYVSSITDLNKIPNLNLFLNWSQLAAQILATIFLVIAVMKSFQSMVSGEKDPNYAELVGSFIISFFLIHATPYIIKDILIRINNQVIISLTQIGVTTKVPNIDAVMNTLATPIVAALIMLFWVIAFLAFTITAAIRYAEIACLIIIGPLIASSYINRSDTLRVYFLEASAVIFTQILHLLLAYWIVSSMTGDLSEFLFSIGCIFLAIKGPGWLRQLFYNSGAGAGLSGAASKLVVYKYLLKR